MAASGSVAFFAFLDAHLTRQNCNTTSGDSVNRHPEFLSKRNRLTFCMGKGILPANQTKNQGAPPVHAIRFALTLLFVSFATLAAAESYPTHPIRLIIPFAPGGSNDVFGRVIAAQLTERLGQSVYVDNRGGAGGIIGADIAAKSAPDGYTLLLVSSAYPVSSSRPNLPYDPHKAFTPIALMGRGPGVLAVHPGVPAHSVKELIDLAKRKPGQLNVACAGVGSFQHMSTEMFKLLTGADVVVVQYKGGGPAMADVLAGHVEMQIGSLIQMIPHIQSGGLRALGVTGPKRSSAIPDVPTIAEAGVPGYESTNWWGLVAPTGTPADIINRLHQEANAVSTSADFQQRLGKEGAEPVSMSIEEFGKFIDAETVRWAKVITERHIKLE